MEEAARDEYNYENEIDWDTFQNIEDHDNDLDQSAVSVEEKEPENVPKLSLNFEDLPWEVECTEEVWKYLTNYKADQNLRKKILERVHRIATGEWHLYVARRVKARNRRKFNTVR